VRGETDFCTVVVRDQTWQVLDKATGEVVATGTEESHDQAKGMAEQVARRHDAEVLRRHRVLEGDVEDALDTLLSLANDGLVVRYETSRHMTLKDYKKYEIVLPRLTEGLKALVRTVHRLVTAQEAETVQAELATLRKQYEALTRLEDE